jgi:anti-sigma B factor antagonist
VVDLTLNTRSQGDRTVLEVAGEVDVYTGPTLRDRISDLLDSGSHDLVVDLGRVDFIDSTGLGVLVGALNRTRELGGTLQLVCSQERVLKLLRITGLDQVFLVRPSLNAALGDSGTGGSPGPAPGPAKGPAGDTAGTGEFEAS